MSLERSSIKDSVGQILKSPRMRCTQKLQLMNVQVRDDLIPLNLILNRPSLNSNTP